MKRIMINHKKCNGCKNCYVACMQAHHNSANSGSIYNLDLTDNANEARNSIKTDVNGNYFPLFCRHCNDPECVITCMSGAMTKNAETGLVLYNKEQCASCFMCVMNCPFGILKPDDKTKTFVIKCDFCIQDTKGPNCVRACPNEALYIKEV
ncbi:MAG: 4Fe-4S dicluster domain-containing protein [Candidatus Bathyarchaeota archaeon]|uniref:4Fe-4S dicluster domain-containing protein n=1 Tax=Candidatus Bathycorpusculum sp. TaxID=2994959 RepID=UPI00282E77AD|nr:4Fe-4S dicluster domain-containing protein [Candidatus Termiticorpusculum sp.]MCL2257790.1 4Fe-4S dicluster domain-containing protein [Candidatus Termiticorpusculum sp.]MCL2291586.1 4Fe-4S dicluster domain-containing protein [Candidatus Termiticorpusculum sp.]